MKMRRLCSCIMALLLAVSMPLTALADDWYLDEGSISVEANESGQTVSQGETSKNDSAPVISQSRPESGSSGNTDSAPPASSESTSNTITITAGEGSTANVTLNGVNISGADGAAIQTSGGGNVTIELDGKNEVQSGYGSAGVEKNNSGSLTITDNNGNGSLKATGGEGGAGIGGGSDGVEGKNSNASNITISGGKVEANGGNVEVNSDGFVSYGGAGIGGGTNGDGSNITISGGTVIATGGKTMNGTEVFCGGAGIGGGVQGTGSNIKIEKDAVVTATGQGNAADIGNGNTEKPIDEQGNILPKQENDVDVTGLYTTGSVTTSQGKTQGTKEPPKDNNNNQSSGNTSGSGSTGGSTGGNPGGSGSTGGNPGIGSTGTPKTVASPKTWSDVAADLGKITASDNKGNALGTVVWLNEEDTLKVTAPANNVLVTGNKADLLQLKEDGVKKINLQTNRVNVSVSNQVLDKITDSGGGFQLTADGTTVSISSTDGNNQKTPGLTLTADKQPEKGKLQVNFRLAEFKEGAGDVRESLNTTLQVSTNAPEASLSYDRKFLNPLMNSEFGKLGLAVGNLLATVDGMLGAITTVNGSGSISIGNNTVNMNGIQFSAADSSENDQLTDMVTNIKFKKEITPVGGSAMVVEVDEKAPMKSASLKVPGSALQSLMDQGVEETALSINGKTTSIKNSNLQTQLGDSQPGSTAVINVKHLANDEITIFAD